MTTSVSLSVTMAERIAGVDLGRQGQVVGVVNRLHHGCADLALAAQHSHSHGLTLVPAVFNSR